MIPNLSQTYHGEYCCKKWQGDAHKKNGLFIIQSKTIPIGDPLKTLSDLPYY